MQGFNMGRYYPPSFDPQKHKSLNGITGTHALGKRARKLDAGILIVRFELPFNIWCGGCDNHIGQGVRYNAEKRKVGAYYSTPIYAFRCKCHLCDHWFEIRTDPQNTRYVVEEGARQQWDPDEGDLPTYETNKDGLDPLEAVEKDTKDKALVMSTAGRMQALEDISEDRWADPYEQSKRLRNAFRKDKATRTARKKGDDALRERLGLAPSIELDVEDETRIKEASQAWQREQSDARRRGDPDRAKRRRMEAEVGPSAGPSRSSALPSTTASNLAARILTTSRHSTDAFLTRPSARSKSLALGVRRPV